MSAWTLAYSTLCLRKPELSNLQYPCLTSFECDAVSYERKQYIERMKTYGPDPKEQKTSSFIINL